MHQNEQQNTTKRTRFLQAGGLAVLLVALAWGAQNQGARAASQEGAEGKVASVGDLSVDHSELLKAATGDLEKVDLEKLQCEVQANKRRYDVLSFTLERLVRDRLAELGAKQAGMETADFLVKEGETRREAVSDGDIDGFIAANQRLARTPRERIEPQVRAFLAENALYKDLEKQFDVERALEPYRVNLGAANGVPKGSANAIVEIVEFSDFQCPFCKQVTPALDGVVEKYGDKVKLVFRQFPLESIHEQAFKAAESALCASDQGKFWEMHDLMFEEQKALSVADLKDKAKRLGLEEAAFEECLDSAKYADQIREDLKDGASAGVTGTPSLFINGRPYSGPRNIDGFSKMIDEELKAAGK